VAPAAAPADAPLTVTPAPTGPGGDGPPGGPGLVPQAQTDAQLLALWLFGRSPHTQRASRREAARFLALAGRPLRAVTPGDVQAVATALAAAAAALTPPSQARTLAAVKSLLASGHHLGHLPFDAGGAVRLPKLRSALAERILSEADVHRLLALEPDARNRALLRLPSAGGLRGAARAAPRSALALSLNRQRPRTHQGAGGPAAQKTLLGSAAATARS